MTVAVSAIADQVWDVLVGLGDQVPGKFRGEFLDSTGQPASPPIGDDGRSLGYLIAYFGAGRRYTTRAAAAPSKLGWSFQVTCAGGIDTRALGVVDAVRGALTGRRVGGALIVEGGDPGPLRRDESVKPSRMYLPLSFTAVLNG